MFRMRQIGVIRTPFNKKEDVPYPSYKLQEVGKIEVFKEFEEALKDIEGFSHLILLYFFDRAGDYLPKVRAVLDKKLHGVFATRHPNRPNPIGLTIVELIERKENVLTVKGVDILNNTPLLDIKPYVPAFDQKNAKIGWLEEALK